MQRDSGFAAASAAMGGIAADNTWLQGRISAGALSMDPAAAHEAARAYDDAAAEVGELVRSAIQLQQVAGLGSYVSGEQLTRKFALKASNGSTGAADLLAQLRDELQRKAELFRQAARDYRSTDEQIAQDLRRSAQ